MEAPLILGACVLLLLATGLKAFCGSDGAEPTDGPRARDLVCICEPWNNTVRIVLAETGQKVDELSIGREPVAAAINRDRRSLLVAHHLPVGRADGAYAAAVVSQVELTSGETVKEYYLPNGGTDVKDLRISPDGRYAAVTHILAQYKPPTRHLRVDWMAGNGLTIIDLVRSEVLGSVLLDDRGKGAANPEGLAWTEDGQTLVVAHSGTHEVSVIDFPALIGKIMELPAPVDPALRKSGLLSEETLGLAAYTPFFPSARRRVNLPEGDLGPREVAVAGRTAFVTNYFSQTVTAINLDNPETKPISRSIRTGGSETKAKQSEANSEPQPQARTRRAVLDAMTLEKRGEFYFHDASICFQGMQSCASCHPGGARVDGLNWDLLNDGIGNPKNTKSLLLAFRTPPAMSTGVRESAHEAVVAGLRHILFTEPKEEIVTAIEAYIRSLKPVPSPRLVNGKLSPSALQGQKMFAKAGCADCHPAPLFTDLNAYDVGTRGPHDKPTDRFDTPTLVEIWRTAPYLHDGSAETIREALTLRNREDKHGITSTLTAEEVDDLCEYVLSL